MSDYYDVDDYNDYFDPYEAEHEAWVDRYEFMTDDADDADRDYDAAVENGVLHEYGFYEDWNPEWDDENYVPVNPDFIPEFDPEDIPF